MEQNDDPVWAKRAKKLQGWLREVGPKSSAEIHREWGKSHNSGMVTNILAYADGVYIQHLQDRWYAMPVTSADISKAAIGSRSAPSPEGCPAESGSAEVECQEQSEGHLEPDEDGLSDKPHPPDCST
jgi:hypothetical protein